MQTSNKPRTPAQAAQLQRFAKRREELTALRTKLPPSKGVVILSLDKFPAGPNPFVSTAAGPEPGKA